MSYNNFKSTTVRGTFQNSDYPDNSILANAIFDRNLTVSGNLTLGKETPILDASGNVIGYTDVSGNIITKIAGTTYTITPSQLIQLNSILASQSWTTSQITTAIANLVSSAPTALDTLGEIATLLQTDTNSIGTILTTLGTKVGLADSNTFTGVTNTFNNAVVMNSTLNGSSITNLPNLQYLDTTSSLTTQLAGKVDKITLNTKTNFFQGFRAGEASTVDSNQNTAIGWKSLMSNNNVSNVAIGGLSMYGNTTGYYNFGLGFNALSASGNASNCLAIGTSALASLTTGVYNVGLGSNSLNNLLSSNYMTAVGGYAGLNCVTSSTCSFFGYNSGQDISGNTYTNSSALGFGSTITASNQIVLGNSSITNNIITGNVNNYNPNWAKLQYVDVSSSISASLATVNTHLTSIDSLIASISAYDTQNTFDLATINSHLTSVDNLITSLASYDTTNTSNLATVNTHLTSLDNSITTLTSYNTTNTSNLGTINTHLTALDASYNALNTTTVTGLSSSIATINTHLGLTDASLNALTSYNTTNTSNISAINTHLGLTDASLNALTSYNTTNTSNISAINTHLGVTDASINTLNSTATSKGWSQLSSSSATGNVGLGYLSMYQNSGYNSTAVGFNSLSAPSSTFSTCTAVGTSSLISLTAGTYNVAVGPNSGNTLTSCNYTTCVGGYSGLNAKTSSNCSFLGYNSGQDLSANTYTNSTAIGYGSTITASNQVVLGNSSTTNNILYGTINGASITNLPNLQYLDTTNSINSQFSTANSHLTTLDASLNSLQTTVTANATVLTNTLASINSTNQTFAGLITALQAEDTQIDASLNSLTAHQVVQDASLNLLDGLKKTELFTFTLTTIATNAYQFGVITGVTSYGILKIVTTSLGGASTGISFFNTGIYRIDINFSETAIAGSNGDTTTLDISLICANTLSNINNIYGMSGSGRCLNKLDASTGGPGSWKYTTFQNEGTQYLSIPMLTAGGGAPYTNNGGFSCMVNCSALTETFVIVARQNQTATLGSVFPCSITFIG